MKAIKVILYLLPAFLIMSCIKEKNLFEGEDEKPEVPVIPTYIYPFKDEVQNAVAEITIQTDNEIDLNTIETEIPYLKYNKSWLFMLTQDDCSHAAYSCTWAAINGKPLIHVKGNEYYYDAPQLKVGDLPPGIYYLGKTLGTTDGTGHEIRFSPTTTLAPEAKWMNAEINVEPGFTDNYYRFYKKSGMVWDDIVEIINYGAGIAFHDVMAVDVNNPEQIVKHYVISQDSILKRLSGRGCKTLAEPNGNKSYVTAALNYADIQTMTAQTGTVQLVPFKVKDDLQKKLLHRVFYSSQNEIKETIRTQLKLSHEEREAVHVGVHSTAEDAWIDFFLWLNNTYGKDGDDSMWFPSMEEYYEYNYYRIHGSIKKSMDGKALKLTVSLPSGKHFYYPSITVNLKGVDKKHITSISSSTSVTGLSYEDYGTGIMLNIDCRKFLVEHATHFVIQYEKNKTASNKADAIYFVNMLKESDKKDALLQRIK